MRNKCSSVLQEHCASELCIFCKTQDSVRRTSNREVSFHSIMYQRTNAHSSLLKSKDVHLTLSFVLL